MNKKLKEVFELFSGNPEYLEKVKKINNDYPDEKENKAQIIALAKEAGIALAEEDFDEVDDDGLKGFSGGTMRDNGTSSCVCMIGGGGTADQWQKTCACVCYGQGDLTEEGQQRFNKSVATRCVFGGGDSRS